MKIIAIDPGSKVTGYAVITESGTLLGAGLIKPQKQTNPADIRIAVICTEIDTLITTEEPDVVVLEWTTGKVGKNRHKGGGSGLAIYGIAIGAIWQTIRQIMNTRDIVLIDESWTRGKPKEKRLAELELTCPAYKRKDDKGGDMGDAILLAQYYAKGLRVVGV